MNTSTITADLIATLRASWASLREVAAGDDFQDLLARVYNASTEDAEALRQRILSGSELGLNFDVVPSAQMNGSLGSYRASKRAGVATMYISGELLSDSAYADTLQRMVFEAIGYHIELLLNADSETAGPQRQQFANLMIGDSRTVEECAAIAAQEVAAKLQPKELPVISVPSHLQTEKDLRAFAARVAADPALSSEVRTCSNPDDVLQLAHRRGFTLCRTELREESENLAAPHWPWSGKTRTLRQQFFAA